jgi:hypothetical protein
MEKTEMSTPISKPLVPNPYQLWNSDLSDWVVITIDWSTQSLAYKFKDE